MRFAKEWRGYRLLHCFSGSRTAEVLQELVEFLQNLALSRLPIWIDPWIFQLHRAIELENGAHEVGTYLTFPLLGSVPPLYWGIFAVCPCRKKDKRR
jgi:hypothetical protein